MPCFLFTVHGYGTWLPDRDDGFVLRGKGLQLRNDRLAAVYRRRSTHDVAFLLDDVQCCIIDALLQAIDEQGLRGHYIATE
jgi:hypothetical protein